MMSQEPAVASPTLRRAAGVGGPLQLSGTLADGYCVVVPMFNEQRNAEQCVRQISAALCRIEPCGRLLVVDDGSRDGTADILRRLSGEYPELVVETRAVNGGYGQALVTGIRVAAALGVGYVLFMDSDLTNDPAYIADFVEKMRADYDVIKATRYSLGGGTRGVPSWRVLISRVGNWVSRALLRLPVTDCTNGFRAIKTELLVRIPYQERGFAIILEELYYLSTIATSYAEVPFVLTSRRADQGPSHFAHFPRTIVQYLKYPVRLVLQRPTIAGPSRRRETR